MEPAKTIVVTDAPVLTGYLHGSSEKERRQVSDPKQQKDYEKGYIKGAAQI
ncbi:MAG: hypothetical protein V7L02_12425 [Nostoc sp.]|uniref:hypothetical protein n=1 Tax=Nostoc sp. TaxID=1180 RepID=UPI002FF5D18C